MSTYNQYADYGGNPYAGGDTAVQSNPYTSVPASTAPTTQYAPAAAGHATLSQQDFLSRVEAVKADIRTLTTHVGQIASLHQRALSSPDATSSGQLESIITQTQVLNTSIKDQIKYLETDAARSINTSNHTIKTTQVGQLKSSFTKQLQEYRQEEATYERRYREQIARQYRIVNPDATDAEVEEATQADWGNEGVFQQAVSSPAEAQSKGPSDCRGPSVFATVIFPVFRAIRH
jgi:syntaxin 1B/2/3